MLLLQGQNILLFCGWLQDAVSLLGEMEDHSPTLSLAEGRQET